MRLCRHTIAVVNSSMSLDVCLRTNPVVLELETLDADLQESQVLVAS